MIQRESAWAMAIVLPATVVLLGPVGGFLANTPSYAASPAAAALPAAIDGPGHHFGFTQASVLAQTTPQQTQTVVAAQATQQAAPNPPLTGNGACATGFFGSCTISGNVVGSWSASSRSLSVNTLAPAGAIPNDGRPILFAPTSLGVERLSQACGIPTGPGSAVFCQGFTAGDLLNGGTVTVRYASATGPIDVTGTVTSTPTLTPFPTFTPQPTPGLQKIITSVNGGPPQPSNTNAILAPGSTVAFRITVSDLPSGPFGTTIITDFLSPNFTVSLSDVSGGSCTIVDTPQGRPAGVSNDATTVQCSVTASTSGDATLAMVARVKPNATSGTDSTANVACFGSTFFPVAAFKNCSTVQAQIAGGTPTPTPTVVAAGAVTLQQAIAQVPASGQNGVPCAALPGTACTASGQVSGQGVVAASMRWTLTATVPAGVPVGTVPFAVFSTTVGQEGFACAPVVAGVTTVSCTGATAGNALQGSSVTVVFGPGVTAVGNVTSATGTAPGLLGAPGPVPPLLPPLPPPPLLPPAAPPALLPPPPAAPVAGLAGAPVGAYPEVPVIPEADSLALLGAGLASLAALGWLRRRRAP